MAENSGSTDLNEIESKKEKSKKLAALLNYFRDNSKKNEKMLEEPKQTAFLPETKGFGNRELTNETDLKISEQEQIDYMPRSKKIRNDKENMEYVETNKTKMEEKILEDYKNLNQEELNEKKEFCDEDDSRVYNNPSYNFFNHKYDENLPIIQIKDQINEELKKTNIILIQGNTGCGKTTQVNF
jgi:flagellar biosynthesis GTPase FlhF